MDDQKRIASLRTGSDFGDTKPPIQYFLDDHLGSSSFILNNSGGLESREEYYPFGETSFGSFAKKRYRFCGKERDEESGLHFYGMRYYAPWICRFVSVDPLAAKYSFYTPYQYAGNKPINAIDLDGAEEKPAESTAGPNGADNLVQHQTPGGDALSLPKSATTTTTLESGPATLEGGTPINLPKGVLIEFEVNGINYNSYYEKKAGGDWKFAGYKDSNGNVYGSNKSDISDQLSSEKSSDTVLIPATGTGESSTDIKSEWTAKQTSLTSTLTQGWFDKTNYLLDKFGDMSESVNLAKAIGKVGKGLAGVGLAFALYDAGADISENGVTYKTATKALLGVGIAVAGLIAAITSPAWGSVAAIAGLVYGIADYFGLVDLAIEKAAGTIKQVGNIAKEAVRQITSIEQSLSKGYYF